MNPRINNLETYYRLYKSQIIIALVCFFAIILIGFIFVRIIGYFGAENLDEMTIAEVHKELFVEFIATEGVVQPYSTIRVNTHETGTVDNILVEEGNEVTMGDTLFVVSNPELIRQIIDAHSDYEKQMISFQEREIVMQQQTINLKRQSLQSTYELNRLKKSFALDQEEFKMGVKSKAQLEVSSDEYEYKVKSTALQLEGLQHDSLATATRMRIMTREVEREKTKLNAIVERANRLVITAPISGQLSYIRVIKGQRINGGDNIAEIKAVDRFKLRIQLDEKWIDHCFLGQSGSVKLGDKSYPLKISKISPEVKDRKVEVDMSFPELMPQNIRLGRVYPVQVNLTNEHEALVIPKGHFIESNGGRWMYRLDSTGHFAEKVPVVLGSLVNNKYEVIDGLREGDRVIISSYVKMEDEETIALK